jgi:formylglycine-generating enzyme required for sulfatase activity
MKILNHPRAVQSGFTFLILSILLAAPSACSSGAAEPATPLPVSTQVSPLDGMVLSYIPAGVFLMGSEEGGDNEQPVHSVTLDAFWMDQTEVTNGMYALCVAAGACEPPRSGNTYTRDSDYGDAAHVNYPVVWVSWYRAEDYCNWAGRRLPTEAEWEYAARGGLAGATYPWGNEDPNCKQANFLNQTFECVGGTSSVGSYPPNGYGLYDMAGNVWEWVADWYDEDYYSTSPAENPLGPASGGNRVIRGGAWVFNEDFMRSAMRYAGDPGAADNDLGFRCAHSP